MDAFIESAEHKLSRPELELLSEIRNGIAQAENDEQTERAFLDLLQFLLLIKECIDKFYS